MHEYQDVISVVAPVFQEQDNLEEFYSRLISTTNQLVRFKWRYIFVNDGSSDESLSILRGLAEQDKRVTVLDLSRNFGKEAALTAGVNEASGSAAVICMDADLQHPPELILELIKQWESGIEVVVTIRKSIAAQPLLRRLGSHLYYWIINKVSRVNMISQSTDFRLYDQRVIKAFLEVSERDRLFRGIMDWLGFKRSYVNFEAPERHGGVTTFSYGALWRLAITGITSFSQWPLKITGYLGAFIVIVSSLLLFLMALDFFTSEKFSFTPLSLFVVFNTFLIGLVMIALGLVAHYIGKIHTEVLARPMYVVRERISAD